MIFIPTLAYAYWQHSLPSMLKPTFFISPAFRGVVFAFVFGLFSELGRRYKIRVTPNLIECDLGKVTIDRQNDEWSAREVKRWLFRPSGLEIDLPGRYLWTRGNIIVPKSTPGYDELRADLLSR